MIVAGERRRGSAMLTYVSALPQTRLASKLPRALQYVLVGYHFKCSNVCASIPDSLRVLYSQATISLFSDSESLFLFSK